MTEDQDIKIAVMQSQIESLREQHKQQSDKLFDSVNDIRKDIKDIYQFVNHSRGSAAVLLVFAGMFGALIVDVFAWWLGKIK
jgi:hypothetical protein